MTIPVALSAILLLTAGTVAVVVDPSAIWPIVNVIQWGAGILLTAFAWGILRYIRDTDRRFTEQASLLGKLLSDVQDIAVNVSVVRTALAVAGIPIETEEHQAMIERIRALARRQAQHHDD